MNTQVYKLYLVGGKIVCSSCSEEFVNDVKDLMEKANPNSKYEVKVTK